MEPLSPAELITTANSAPDDEVRRAAQRQIVTASSLRVARTVLGPTLAEKIALIDEVGRADGVPVTILPVVLAAIGTPVGDELRRVLDRIRRHRASDLGVIGTGAVGELVRAVALDAGPREVLTMLDWASGDDLDDGDHVRPFVAAAVAVMERVPESGLDEYRFATGMGHLFAIGGAVAAPLIDRWLASPTAGELVMRRMFDIHGQRQRRGEDRRVVDWLAAVWTRTPDRHRLAQALAHATGQNRGISGRAWFADWAWARFVDHPDERALIYQAFASWRDDLVERRNAMPRRSRPGGASTVDHLQVWGPLDLDRLANVIEECARMAAPGEWAAVVDAVFAIVGDARARGRDAWMAALVGACKLGHEVTNRVRDREPAPELEPAVDRLVAHGQSEIDALRADGLEIDPRVASRIDDLETSIRLSLEPRERRAEAARRAEEGERRAAEQAAAARQRELEVQRMHAEAAAAQAEAIRRQQELLAALHAPRPAAPGLTAQPQVDLTPLDREPFFGGPLPTLVDYTRFMVRISRGGDALAVMAEHGLDPIGYGAVAQTWTHLISRRPDLAQRFGILMGATWE